MNDLGGEFSASTSLCKHRSTLSLGERTSSITLSARMNRLIHASWHYDQDHCLRTSQGGKVTSIRVARIHIWWKPHLPIWRHARGRPDLTRPIRVETPPTPSELRRFLSLIYSFERQTSFQLPQFTHIFRLAQEGSLWIWTKRAVLEIAYLGIATGIWYRRGLPRGPGLISEAPLMTGSYRSGAPPIVRHPMPLTRRDPPNAVELEVARIERYRMGDFRIMADVVPLNYFDADFDEDDASGTSPDREQS